MAVDRIGPSDRQRELANLNFKALSIFMIVADEGSMVGATKRLKMSLSGVSQQITNLETALGVKLFDRRARPIALTPAGVLLRHHSDNIVDVVTKAQMELAELSVTSLPEFRLGIIDDLDASITPDLVRLFQTAYPRCLISASTGRSDHLTDAFIRRDLDVVVSGQLPRDGHRFDVFPILREPFMLVTAKRVLSARRPIMEQLESMPFIGFNDSMPLGRLVSQQFRRVGMKVEKRVAFDATRAVHSTIVKSGGWTVSTPLCVLDTPRCVPDLEFAPLPFAGFSRQIYLVNRIGELGSLPKRLAELCQQLILEQLKPQVDMIAPWLSRHFHAGEVGGFADEVADAGFHSDAAGRAPSRNYLQI